ncbi:MAG: hypothetical protein KatS3mg060_2329 [Dehalococcoidia bacterium]|nr:MAG: hypothetical protein KatS3mg060_2329 [Dehalococcoidia bacterium]
MRLNVSSILGLEEADARVIRSLPTSQRPLGAREIPLIQHMNCGKLTFKDDSPKGEIQREVGFRPPFSSGASSNLDEDVRQSIARVKASPLIPH